MREPFGTRWGRKMDWQQREQQARPIILSTLVVLSIALTIVASVYRQDDAVYTQLFYIPILVAAIWYQRKAIVLAALLGILHISADYAVRGYFDPATLLRGATFVFVAVLAVWLTEQKDEINRRLRRSNSELANVIEFYPDATLVVDNAGRVVAWNRAMVEMTGVRAADMIGRGDMEYTVPFYGQRTPMLIDLVGRPEAELRAKYSNVTVRNGRLEAVSTSARIAGNVAPVLHGTASKLYDADGRAIGAIESVRDISEHQRIERLQRESDARFRHVVDSTMDAIVTSDADMNITMWNQAAERIFGYGSAEMLGKPLSTLMPEEVRPRFLRVREVHSEAIGTLSKIIETIALRKDGTRFPIEMSLSSWTLDGKTIFSAVVRDITDRKRADLAL
ncbi:MAG TPA: PAS domain S-box protein, partial [Methanocella sp.]|nr:PAS domain S-box protein [Methanocella sp.]